MKKKTLLCLAALTGILAAEPGVIQLLDQGILPNAGPVSKPDPNATAKAVVMSNIVARLQPTVPRFSRMITPTPFASYGEVQLADNEKRLPFSISMVGAPPEQSVSGYVRLSDNAIFIFRPGKKDYIRSTQDPRFAPEKEIKVDPKKPT